MSNAEKISINDKLQLYSVHTTKFKSTRISFYFKRILSKKEATKNALLSMVIKRASSIFPKTEDISKYLQQNFGAEFSVDVAKKGEYQIIVFSIDFINEDYIQNRVPILDNMLNFLLDIIFNQKDFQQDYFDQEKRNLEMHIMALKNDKKGYAKMRCIEEMYKEERYSVCEIGNLEDLNEISKDSLFEHYKNIFLTSKFDVFVVGDCNLDLVTQKISDAAKNLKIIEQPSIEMMQHKEISEVRNFTEQDDIVQAKLCIGCRTNIEPNSELYFPLIIYNTLFGGGAYSKLFNNVREKLSLAYYVFSMFDRFKGVMTINAGILEEKFKMAYDEILHQQDMIKNNQFTDEELETAKLSAMNAMKTQSDNAESTTDFYYSSVMACRDENIDGFVQKLNQVTREQVLAVSTEIQLDTIFLLKGRNK